MTEQQKLPKHTQNLHVGAEFRYLEPDVIGLALVPNEDGSEMVVINGFDIELRPVRNDQDVAVTPVQSAKFTLGLQASAIRQLHTQFGEILERWERKAAEDEEL